MALIELDTPNETFVNDADLVDQETIVFAHASNNAFTNTGVIWTTGNEDALRFTELSFNATITNESTGYIRGGNFAVNFEGIGATIANAGKMIGGSAGIALADASGVAINNAFGGTITGADAGIYFSADGGSEINNDGIVFGGQVGVALFAGTLTNSGEIGGSGRGILSNAEVAATIVNTNFGVVWSSDTAIAVLSGEAVITNSADCLITGTQAAITTTDTASISSSRISLTNLGKIDGLIDCDGVSGNVNDTLVNKGIIDGDVFLGVGDDSFNGAGGTSGKVFGEDGNDSLTGGSANNYLDGGAGNDTVRGGLGRDQLLGGADRDLFDFDSIKESLKGANRDIIHDFKRGQDDIDLRTIDAKTGGGNQKFKFIGKQDFHDQKGELRYEDKGSKVIVQGDVNGDGKADFEIMVKVGALSSGDFLL